MIDPIVSGPRRTHLLPLVSLANLQSRTHTFLYFPLFLSISFLSNSSLFLPSMAELAALTNLSAVARCGVKLSISLYEFAVPLGFASRELKKLGSDIAHFCSVLEQVQSVLRAKSFKVLPNTIQTTLNILDKSQELFDEINAILGNLRKDDRSQVDLLKRVKWTLKKPKVLMLQEGLRSCDAMLHLMLTTMSFAQILAATKQYEL
jgi:uncharacterized protein YdcH (DUF465 family)